MVPGDKVQPGRSQGRGSMWALTFELLYGSQIGVIRQREMRRGPMGA